MPGEIADWLLAEYDKLLVAYSSTSPEKVKAVQVRYGANTTSEVLESFFADVAMVPVKGVAQVLCAGGETTSAIVEALNLPEHQIGPEIALGVPALRAKDDLVLSLESGNSGAEHFFGKAHKLLTGKHSGCRADKPGRLHV